MRYNYRIESTAQIQAFKPGIIIYHQGPMLQHTKCSHISLWDSSGVYDSSAEHYNSHTLTPAISFTKHTWIRKSKPAALFV